MTWIFVPPTSPASRSAPVLEDSTSASDSPSLNTDVCVTSKGKPMRLPSLSRAWKTKPYMRLLSGITSKHSTANRGVAEWISSTLDTPASRSQRRVFDEVKMTLDTSGRAFVESSKKSPQLSFFARTSPLIYESASTLSAKTWNAWVTTLRQECSRRGVAVRPISENVYSGSAEEEGHLPTPTATPYGTSQNEGAGVAHKRPSKGTPSLDTAAKRGLIKGKLSAMPTPTSTTGGTGYVRGDGKWVPTLEMAAKTGVLPTPMSSDANGGRELGRVSESGTPWSSQLSDLAEHGVLPTPQAHDAKSSPGAGARARGGFQSSLPAAVLLPTPRASPGSIEAPESEGERKSPGLAYVVTHSEQTVEASASLRSRAKKQRSMLDQVLPTPKGQDARGAENSPSEGSRKSPTLGYVMANQSLPTPRVSQAGESHSPKGGRSLVKEMKRITEALPTPSASQGGRTPPEGTTLKGKRPDGGKAQMGLDSLAKMGALPTPQAYSKQDSNQPGLTPLDIKVRGMYGEEPLPTPTVNDSKNDGGPSQQERNTRALNALASQGALPTPRAAEAEHAGRSTITEGHQKGLVETVLSTFKERSVLPTPTRMDGVGARNATDETGWATVEAQGGKCRGGEGKERHSGTTLSDVAYSTGVEPQSPSSSQEKGKGGKLNPEFVEWMMNTPTEWTDYRVSVTQSFQLWLRVHSQCSSLS